MAGNALNNSDAQLELRFGTMADAHAAAEIELRRRALAEPLGLPVEAVRFEFEARSLHLWALLDEVLIGCVLFYRDNERGGRLYQMAVEPSLQNSGVGRLLVQRLETRLRELGVHEVRLHARGPSVGFYAKLGYAAYDAPFFEVGIEHRHMRREL
ncbi:MAG TPA: GNAT family N-acetyltransferase [Polyangiales bacterium]|nr:GNAT family N-acetyltransferase [Polyangiales bacterium]